MTTKTSLKLALGTTIAAGIALGTAALADNPFSADKLSSGYLQLAENKAGGEMKCGAGMCGNSMKTEKTASKTESDTCPADTDKDGKVTKEEFLKHHEAMFDEADANKDGALDADERQALHKKMGEGKCGAKTPANTAAPEKAAEEKK